MSSLILRRWKHGVEQTDLLVRAFVDADILERSVLITLELIDSIIHQRRIEDVERHKQLEIRDRQPRYFLEQSGFQLRDDIIEAPLAEIRQVHEYRYARSEFD